MDSVTFGITSFNRPEHLRRLVESIREHYPSARIVVADNGSDFTVALPCITGQVDELHLLPYDAGLCACRNRLVDTLETPFLLLLEDDFVFTGKTRVEHFLGVLQADRDIGCVGGMVRNTNGAGQTGLPNVFNVQGKLEPIKDYSIRPDPVQCNFVANFALFRRQVFVDHRWDERLKVGEHHDYFWRVYKLGRWKVAHTRHVEVDHDRSERSQQYTNQRQRAGFYNRITFLCRQRPNLLVFAVGHSGTRVVVRMAEALGWIIPTPHKEGVAEPIAVQEVNKAIQDGRKAGGKPAQEAMEKALAGFAQPWVIKDPRMVLTLDAWKQPLTLYSPVLLFIERNPERMEKSYRKYDKRGLDDPLPWMRTIERPQGHTARELIHLARQQFESWRGPKIHLDYEEITAAVKLFDFKVAA